MPYSPLVVMPMREELTSIGFKELMTVDDVDTVMNETTGSTLLVFNSVCLFAAKIGRPGVRLSLDHDFMPVGRTPPQGVSATVPSD